MDLSRLKELLERNVMKPSFSNSKRLAKSVQNNVRNYNLTNAQNRAHESLRSAEQSRGLPSPLSQTEFADIDRCFRRANVKVEHYLDFDELKTFMELRRCPITNWEATKLLEYADPTYHYYISLDQIVELTTLYGFGTHNPIQMTRSEFDIAIRHAFRLTSTHDIEVVPAPELPDDTYINFNRALNYFETRVAQEREKKDVDTSLSQYRKSFKNNRNVAFKDEFQKHTESSKLNIVEEPEHSLSFESKVDGHNKSKIRRNYNKSPTVEDFYVRHSTKIASSRELRSPPVESIFKRRHSSKRITRNQSCEITLDLIRDQQTKTSNIILSAPPPLPAPIVPNLPVEWLSSNKVEIEELCGSTSKVKHSTNNSISASRSASTKTIYRKKHQSTKS